MPDLQLSDLIHLPAWAIVIMLIINRLGLAKVMPNLFGIWRNQSEQEQERATAQLDFDRQDEITILSSMIALQTEGIRQNEKLLGYLMSSLDSKIATGFESIRLEMVEVRQELRDIGDRWLAASKEIGGVKSHLTVFSHELVQLVDKMRVIERHLEQEVKPNS